MRVNIYAEEITNEVEVTTKTVDVVDVGEVTFYGIRMFLASPEALHHKPIDDDRSAVTFWVPWTRQSGHRFLTLEALFRGLVHAVQEAAAMEPDRAG